MPDFITLCEIRIIFKNAHTTDGADFSSHSPYSSSSDRLDITLSISTLALHLTRNVKLNSRLYIILANIFLIFSIASDAIAGYRSSFFLILTDTTFGLMLTPWTKPVSVPRPSRLVASSHSAYRISLSQIHSLRTITR